MTLAVMASLIYAPTAHAASAPAAEPGINVVCETRIIDQWWGTARCNSPNYRVMVVCEENSGRQYVAFGPWVSNWVASAARCHEYSWVIAVYAQF